MKIKIAPQILSQIIAYMLILLFLYAAASKLMDYNVFKAQIGTSPLIMQYSNVIAWLIPVVEILIAAMLFIPKLRLAGFYLSFFIMLSFSFYIYIILNYSPYVPCSCGGILSSMGWMTHLVFNIVFTLLSIIGLDAEVRCQSNSSSQPNIIQI